MRANDRSDFFKVEPKPPKLSEDDKTIIANGGHKLDFSVVNLGSLNND